MFSCSINLCGILDHFGYKAPDFSFIHESIWYDLGHFENWLIDHRGLNLGDVVPFRSCRLPGPTFPVSDESQTSASEEEEPFVSASSTTSKAVSLPKNLNGSKWEPPSSGATAGSVLALSSIEKLDGNESFMAPLSKEVIEKADVLLKMQRDASLLASDSINGWLEKTVPNPPPSVSEVHHPLASSPPADTSGATFLPRKTICEEPLVGKIKEEPMPPESDCSLSLSASFTDTQLKV